jgi:Flp pilus assembly protein TadD
MYPAHGSHAVISRLCGNDGNTAGRRANYRLVPASTVPQERRMMPPRHGDLQNTQSPAVGAARMMHRLRRHLLFLLPFAAVTPAAADTSNLATYLKARAADAAGEVDTATAAYARALAAAPTSSVIAARAYREALASGDVALATRAAAVLRGAADAPNDLPLLPLALAAARDDRAGTEAAIDALTRTPLAVLAPSLRAWLAVTAGQNPASALAAGVADKNPVTQRLAAETAALVRIARGDASGGIAAVEALRATGSPLDLRLSAGQLLFGTGHPQEARALLSGDDPVFVALRRGAPAQPTLGFGVGRLLGRIAGDLTEQDAGSLSIALARAALIAHPEGERARLLLAGALAQEGAVTPALATLDGIGADSPFASAAATARISILANAGRDDEALGLARRDAERAGAGGGDWQAYAERLIAANRPAEAVVWFRRIVDADPAAWGAWMQYGGALEQAGQWPAARVALQKAVALAPAEPLALNYLGYAQAERGIDLAGCTALLERAHVLKPDDASIADSLGWAYVLGGDTARALPLIERAAAGDPINAEIGEHLGDLYWKRGRRYEARYAWRAAALTASAEDAARLTAKATNGLPR